MKDLLLGIDVGTSAVKTALFSWDGTVAAQSSAEYPVYYPKHGWAEQNPNDWWNGCRSALNILFGKSGIDSNRIACVGIAGQSWSAIPIDSDGKCLCNTPIWYDQRASGICTELSKNIGDDNIFEVCGNPLQPTYTLPKILWYKKYAPDVYKNTSKILQSNSYIAFKLTGEIYQDISQAYGLQCFDMRKGKWHSGLCIEMGIRLDMLPDIVPCHEIIGKVTHEAAKISGLAYDTPVVAGGLDAACGTLGAGVINNGETQEQGGQAGGMSICMDSYRADPRLILSHHVVPRRWLLQGGTVGGGGVLRWFEKEFAATEREAAVKNGTSSFAEIDKLAATVEAGSDGVVFLPYMAGERSPIWNSEAKGVYFGLDYSKTRAHMARASLEGVAFSLRHNLETAEKAGAKVEKLRSVGGAANSLLWTQIKADITGKPVDVPASDTAATLGAAILAGVASGIYKSFSEAISIINNIIRMHEPKIGNQAVYDKAFDKYIRLYESVKPLF